jgi:hypothetical protein
MPFAVFVVSILISAFAQRAFFDALARLDASVSTDEELGKEILSNPQDLVGHVAGEVPRRLGALVHRAPDARVERLRWIAIGGIGLMLMSFAWWILATGSGASGG